MSAFDVHGGEQADAQARAVDVGVSQAAITFARRIFAEMTGREATADDVEQLVVLAIAFDSTSLASHHAVLAEREACAVIAADNGAGTSLGGRIARKIRARGAAS